ncbi:APC family permease [Dactylosporangium sp. NPDC000555]|uniref:APC family permease n=1 Tax=Dactylosporangium sp. NPDC000555 TaxID=3154260 RepID=UPI00332E5CA0
MSIATMPPPGGYVSKVDSALNRNKLTVLTVILMVIAAAAPFTVIGGGATAGWAVTEVLGIPVAYVAMAVTLGVFSVGYTEMSRHIVNSGAFYAYVAQGLGRITGLGAAGVAVVAYNFMQIGLYGGFGAVASGFLKDRWGVDLAWWLVAAIGWAVIAVLGVLSIELSGAVLGVLLGAEIVIALVFAVVEVLHPAGGTVTYDTLNPSQLFSAGTGAALATAVAGFVGFESTAVYSEETRNAKRNIPRATYLSLIIIGLLYAFCSWAMSVAAGPANIIALSAEHGSETMFTLVDPHLAKIWLDLGHGLFITSLFAALLSFHNTAARYTFSLGRERVLPGWFGTAGRRFRAPLWGSLTQSLLAIAVLAVFAVTGLDPFVYLFFWWTVTGGFGVLILMTVTSLAVVVYFVRHRTGELAQVSAWRRFIAPVLGFLILLVVLIVTLQEFDTLLGVTADSPWRWIFPAAFASAAVIGAGWAAILRATRPAVYRGIGQGASADLLAARSDGGAAHRAETAAPR